LGSQQNRSESPPPNGSPSAKRERSNQDVSAMKSSSSTANPSSSHVTVTSPQGMSVEIRNQRSLSLVLESVFQISLRKDAAYPLVYIENSDGVGLLSPSNLSEHVMMRIMTERMNSTQSGSSMLYFIGCYKRMTQKEATSTGKVAEDLVGYVAVCM
jgi:hypothetical protein